MGSLLSREQEHIGDLPTLIRTRLVASPDEPGAAIDGGQLALAAMEAVRHSFLHAKDSGRALVTAQRAFEDACWSGQFTARIEAEAREALEAGGALEQFVRGLLARTRATKRAWISLAAVDEIVSRDVAVRLGNGGGARALPVGQAPEGASAAATTLPPSEGAPPGRGQGTFLDFVQLAITVVVHAADYQYYGRKPPKGAVWPGAQMQQDAAVSTAVGLLAQALVTDAYDAYTKRLFGRRDALQAFLGALLLIAVPVIMAV